MNPLIADLIRNLGGVVLGWALGLVSALLVDWRKKRTKVRRVRTAVSRELREVAFRFLFLTVILERRGGRLNRQLLQWAHEQTKRYVGPNPTEEVLASVEGLLKATDEQLAQLAAHETARGGTNFFPREEASYSMVAAAEVHEFEPEFAVRLLDILSNIRMFNETRENHTYYFRLTFDSSVTAEDQAKAFQNVRSAEEQMAKRTRIIVDKITEFEEMSRT